ncbi:MAG TPA: DUF3465 domain-containing protein [Pirellulales bacterium]|jgi:hypothetical protein
MDQRQADTLRRFFSSRSVQRAILLLILAAVAYFGGIQGSLFKPAQQGDVAHGTADADQRLEEAFAKHERNVTVQGRGSVVRILADDQEGLEHQKFILRLESGQELLIAHNIDVANRVDDLRKGDTVEFCGEYEWNSQGGVVHWTHRDRAGRHADGWLKHEGRVYQ